MALLPPFMLDAVTAIGTGDDASTRVWVGTGFLFGLFLNEGPDPGVKQFQVFLVTNKHVLQDFRSVFLKFNSAEDATSRDYRVELVARNGRPMWVGHADDDVDVAVLPVNAKALEDELRKFAFFQSDSHVSTIDNLKQSGICEGDGVYALGFPMGMVDPLRQYAICRMGGIARIRDMLEGNATDFLIDVTVFPGNSGGPVILQPGVVAVKGTKSAGKANLVGLVKSYVPYHDVAVSQQTRAARIVFEENSGLAAVEPVDRVLETIELARVRLKSRVTQAKWRARQKTSGSI